MTADTGFSLVELLVATAIMLTITAAAFIVVTPAHGVFQSQGEQSDMQQRLRVGVEAMAGSLRMAGAGPYSGSPMGALNTALAPVLPYRIGTTSADPGRGVFYRPDAITVIYVPSTPSQSTVRDQMASPSADVAVDWRPGCPVADPRCGFTEGMRALIVDRGGAFDTFTVTSVQGATNTLQHRDERFSRAYRAGAILAEVSMHTYWLKSDSASDTFELMHYDGHRSDLPLVDHVVSLGFEYFGEASPPTLRKPVTDPVGPWTTYGPTPPALDTDDPTDTWPAGENCVFRADAPGGQHTPRLPTLAVQAAALVPLAAAILTDGPWCPDASASNRFDADLLRIRRIRVTLRLQSGVASLRGPAGALFSRGGTSRVAERFVPDQEIRFDVTPRNLNLGR